MSSPRHDYLYSIAEDQAGYFTAKQAVEVGFSRPLLSYFARTGRFIRITRGIYRLSRFPASRYEDLFVAWLRTGPNSVISHDSALAIYDLTDILPAEVHVTIPRKASRRRSGIRLHTNAISSEDIVRREGLPVTAIERTISDITKAGQSREVVEQAILEAIARGLTTQSKLIEEAKRRGGRAAKMIKKVLEGM